LFFFSGRRRHTRCLSDWSSDVCSSDLFLGAIAPATYQGTVGVLSDELVSGGSDGTQEALDARRLTTDAEFTYYTMHQSRHNFERSEERRVGKQRRNVNRNT